MIEVMQKTEEKKGERMFLFLSIILIAFLLVGIPSTINFNLDFLNFFDFQSLTTAAVSNIAGNSQDYLLGTSSFFILILVMSLFFRFLRKPRKAILIDLPEKEGKNSPTNLRKGIPLSDHMDTINQEIISLREEETPSPPTIPRKITKIINLKEIKLKKEQEKINSKLQGYHKPTIIDAPKREESLAFSMSYVEKKLSELPVVNPKKVKFKATLPADEEKIRVPEEEKEMNKEFDNLSAALEEGKKNPFAFLQRHPWKKRKYLHLKTNQKIKNEAAKSELQEVEEEIAKL